MLLKLGEGGGGSQEEEVYFIVNHMGHILQVPFRIRSDCRPKQPKLEYYVFVVTSREGGFRGWIPPPLPPLKRIVDNTFPVNPTVRRTLIQGNTVKSHTMWL